MPTKRTPRRLEAKRVITLRAVEIFRRLRAAPYESEQWWEAHSALHDELGARPWQWPCVSDPRAVNPYPVDSHAWKDWERGRQEPSEAAELWRALAKAARAATSKHAAKPPDPSP
jgi:hypothetical protein